MTADTRWVCPACGSQDVEGLAWVRLNGERVASWDENAGFWCPRCERHHKGVCEVDVATKQCLTHNQAVLKCREEHRPPARLGGKP